MDAKQFAWLYLVENGLAGRQPSYYGGSTVVDERVKKSKYMDIFTGAEKTHALYMKEIKEHGVDWKKTLAPESDAVSLFSDTFHDPTKKEVIFGELVLKNGLGQSWYAEALEVSDVFEMMAKANEAMGRFYSLFGEA